MLGSKKSSFSVSGPTTLISKDTVVVGNLHFSGNLDVEGLVQGNIMASTEKEALVRVVDKGRVEGEIRAPSVIVNGAVEGNIHSSQHLELASRARVKGNVFYTQLEMAAGSEVNGSLTHIHDVVAAEPASSGPTEQAATDKGQPAAVGPNPVADDRVP